MFMEVESSAAMVHCKTLHCWKHFSLSFNIAVICDDKYSTVQKFGDGKISSAHLFQDTIKSNIVKYYKNKFY